MTTSRLTAAERLIVALDVESVSRAEVLLDQLRGVVSACKIGTQLFTAAGPAAVEMARARDFRVFLDLKFHDIPNTVAGAVREATRLGVFMLDVHASGGAAMMRAAADSALTAAAELKVERPICLGVTVLTSFDRRALQQELNVPLPVEAHVLHLATVARDAGLDGCVASPQEIRPLRLALGAAWVIVTPGIRPSSPGVARRVAGQRSSDADGADDQVRTATAAAAIRAGADYLVVGRPVIQAPDPAQAAAALIDEMRGA